MKKGKQVIMLLIACAFFAGIGHVLHVQDISAATADFKEFTLIRAESSESRGPYPLKRVVLEARRADGARVEGELPTAEEIHPSRRIVTLVPERIRVDIHEGLRIKSTLYRKDTPAPRPPAPDAQCGISHLSRSVSPVYVGEGDVLGFKTVILQTTTRMEGGETFVRKEWRAPDLDCVVVKVSENRLDQSGNTTGQFEIDPVKIVLGNPDPASFEVPSDYSEKSPSQMRNAVVNAFGNPTKPMRENMRKRLEQEDAAYSANHRAAGVN